VDGTVLVAIALRGEILVEGDEPLEALVGFGGESDAS
jgi:hypothetical protein